jgi:hypothetical protein
MCNQCGECEMPFHACVVAMLAHIFHSQVLQHVHGLLGPWASHFVVNRLKYWALKPQVWGCFRGKTKKTGWFRGLDVSKWPQKPEIRDLSPRNYGLKVGSLNHVGPTETVRTAFWHCMAKLWGPECAAQGGCCKDSLTMFLRHTKGQNLSIAML